LVFSPNIESLNYGENKAGILQILLWFNIATLHHGRYPFDLHAASKWSIEHIHSQNAEEWSDNHQAADWKKCTLDELKKRPPSEDLDRLIKALENLEPTVKTFADASALLNEIASIFAPDMDTAEHLIQNLALLSAPHNSKLNNAPFPVKRSRILHIEKCGELVPQATIKVFLKGYSSASGDSLIWDNKDRTSYLEAIKAVMADAKNLKPLVRP
jgi:hypothetical protein